MANRRPSSVARIWEQTGPEPKIGLFWGSEKQPSDALVEALRAATAELRAAATSLREAAASHQSQPTKEEAAATVADVRRGTEGSHHEALGSEECSHWPLSSC